MISHKYRCIMIHIPRTGGSSIERWIHGKDWWSDSPSSKHLVASQAKRLYREYWDDYFKFAFVRNPWDRMVSCLHYAEHFGFPGTSNGTHAGETLSTKMDLSGYKELFGYPVTLEHDHRFHEREQLLTNVHQPNRVYLNILDEPIDFVGRFESLQDDTKYIQQEIGIRKPFRVHVQKSKRKCYDQYYDQRTRDELRDLYCDDIEAFGYEFQQPTPLRRLLSRLLKTA